MTVEAKVVPVLNAEQWKTARSVSLETVAMHYSQAAVIAVQNDALPDSDPRKITRDKIAAMRDGESAIFTAHNDRCTGRGCKCMEYSALLDSFADALASYLPPIDG